MNFKSPHESIGIHHQTQRQIHFHNSTINPTPFRTNSNIVINTYHICTQPQPTYRCSNHSLYNLFSGISCLHLQTIWDKPSRSQQKATLYRRPWLTCQALRGRGSKRAALEHLGRSHDCFGRIFSAGCAGFVGDGGRTKKWQSGAERVYL